MLENKELNQEQLEKVSGGGNCASPDHLPETHGAHIYASELAANKELYINKTMYCVLDKDDSCYALVLLLDVSKTSFSIFEKFTILEMHGKFYPLAIKCQEGGTYEISSSYITMYAYE